VAISTCSTFMVASDVPGYRSVAGDGRAALLVPPGDVAALAAGLRRVLSSSADADRLRAAGWERLEQFTMAELARRYIAIYERVVNDHAKYLPCSDSTLLS
jgi:glycosyltransferase involved in cell wall biosynthesis